MPSEYVFSLSDQETNLMVEALIKLPYEKVAPLIASLQMQIQKQAKEAETKEAGNQE